MEIHRDLAPLWNTSFFRAGDAPEPTSAFFLNDTIGWLAFQRGDIFRTSDGGNSWCQVADGNTLWPDRTRPAGFHALHFRSRLEGIGVGLNEGSMWTRAGLPETIRELSLHGDEGLAIGRSRALSGDLSLKNAASAISTTLLRGKDLVLRACIKTTGPRSPTSAPSPTPSTGRARPPASGILFRQRGFQPAPVSDCRHRATPVQQLWSPRRVHRRLKERLEFRTAISQIG
jgi:hypothetical protein